MSILKEMHFVCHFIILSDASRATSPGNRWHIARWMRNVHRCIMQFCFLLLAEGWRDSVLGAPRRLLVTLGSLSRDSSPCPAAVSHHFVHPLSTKSPTEAMILICRTSTKRDTSEGTGR